MAQKRYYWLKLMGDFFSQPKIKKLRHMVSGDTYVIIYLKLQLLSLKNKGLLLFEGIEATFAEELALTIDESLEDVQATLAFLAMQNLIVQMSEAEFMLPETAELIGSEAASTIRVRKSREQKKQLALQCNAIATQCNGEIDIDLDAELDLETQLDIDTASDIVVVGMANSDGMDLQQALEAFVEYRKNRQKPLTAEGIRLIKLRLNQFACTEKEKVDILTQSIRCGWADVYPIKNNNVGNTGTKTKYRYGNTKFQNYKPADYDFDEIERLEREKWANDGK